MFSKAELEFLKNPEKFNADYARVLRCRIRAKTTQIYNLTLLQSSGFSAKESCNGVTEFSNGQQNQISANQALFVNLKWAEPDSDRRPLARKANVLTRLDDRPT
jgi:hypothetical protein